MRLFELYFKRKDYIGDQPPPPIDMHEIDLGAQRITKDDFVANVALTMDTAKFLRGNVSFMKYKTLYIIYDQQNHVHHFFM